MNVTIHNTNSPSALCITEGCDYNYNGFLEILCMILNVVPHTDSIKMLSVNITQRQVNHLITGGIHKTLPDISQKHSAGDVKTRLHIILEQVLQEACI